MQWVLITRPSEGLLIPTKREGYFKTLRHSSRPKMAALLEWYGTIFMGNTTTKAPSKSIWPLYTQRYNRSL